jgi:WD40 repeat protein
MAGQIPVLLEGEEGQWHFRHAATHRSHVTAVDWHPHMNVIVSGSADYTACLVHLDI